MRPLNIDLLKSSGAIVIPTRPTLRARLVRWIAHHWAMWKFNRRFPCKLRRPF